MSYSFDSTLCKPGAVQEDVQDLRIHLRRLETEEKQHFYNAQIILLTFCCNCKEKGHQFEEVRKGKGRPPVVQGPPC